MRAGNIAGKSFGRLIALRATGKKGLWDCVCLCGKRRTARASELTRGAVKSCGCLTRDLRRAENKAKVTHGEGARGKVTPEYAAWVAMNGRCNQPRHQLFEYYGARGIRVCAAWNPQRGGTYEAFLADMGRRPSEDHSIDRRDTNGNYEPGNCRWATRQEQNSNMRSNIFVELDGVRETMTDACRRRGVPTDAVRRARLRGLSPEDALRAVVASRMQRSSRTTKPHPE